MTLKRPVCDSCGAKIYPILKPFRVNRLRWGQIPSHCPNCGKEISNETRARLDNHDSKLYVIWFGSICSVIIIIFIIIAILNF